MTNKNLSLLQEKLGYRFKDPTLLEKALTHRSCLNQPGITESYERMEFLGDAILEMLISVDLFKKYPDKMEGYLTAARSAIVRTESLSEVCKAHGISSFVRMSKGEEATGGRSNASILEDIIESLIGAIYLDGGLDEAKNFFDKFIVPIAKDIMAVGRLKDPKSSLQEKVQAQGLPSPVYQTLEEKGLDHNKIFEVAVLVDGRQLSTGTGRSKQDAEQKAAQKALELL